MKSTPNPFNSYEGPSPWESNSSNKENPFDTNQNNSIKQDTSIFNSDKNVSNQNTSVFDDIKPSIIQKTSIFDTPKIKEYNKEFIYYKPIKRSRKTNTIIKKFLKNKYKEVSKTTEIKSGLIKELKKKEIVIKKVEPKIIKNKPDNFIKIVHEEVDLLSELLINDGINDLTTEKVIKSKKIFKTKSFSEHLEEAKNDIIKRKAILNKDKEHNLSIRILEAQGKTKKEILKIINLKNKPKFIKYEKNFVNSLPMEKIGKMTYCSRTARKNLYRLGVDRKLIPVGESAIASMKMYGDRPNYSGKLTKLPKGTNVLDLFIDTLSKYEHRAAAYISNNEWFVLDPYTKLKSNKINSILPIPMNEYLAKKTLLGAYPYSIDKSV